MDVLLFLVLEVIFLWIILFVWIIKIKTVYFLWCFSAGYFSITNFGTFFLYFEQFNDLGMLIWILIYDPSKGLKKGLTKKNDDLDLSSIWFGRYYNQFNSRPSDSVNLFCKNIRLQTNSDYFINWIQIKKKKILRPLIIFS